MRRQQRLLVLPLAFAVTWAASALALPAHSTARPATLCAPDERPLFSCHVARKRIVSLCDGTDTVHYRYGQSRSSLKMDIAPDAIWSNLRIGSVTGGDGGGESHVRLSHKGYHYVLNQGHAGSLHATGLRPWAGLVVYRGTRQIETQACRGELLLEANWLDAVSSRAPGGINISEPADSFFDAWIM